MPAVRVCIAQVLLAALLLSWLAHQFGGPDLVGVSVIDSLLNTIPTIP